MRNKFIYLGNCITVGIIMIIFLNIIHAARTNKKNGFVRNFREGVLYEQKKTDIIYNSYYVAGIEPDNIYLGNYTAPARLLIYDYSLQNSAKMLIRIPYNPKITGEGLTTVVDANKIFCTDRISTSFYYGLLTDSCHLAGLLATHQFSKSVPLTENTVVIRIQTKDSGINQLVKASPNGDMGSIRASYKLEAKGDNYFSTDGMMEYDRTSCHLLYVYYYRNEAVILDTALHEEVTIKTIDTVTIPQIETGEIASEHVRTLSAPPGIVNWKSSISGEWLLIESALRADNENNMDFLSKTVIDVYSLKTKKYVYSFYLELLNDEKPSSIVLKGNFLAVIYDHYLFTCRLHLF